VCVISYIQNFTRCPKETPLIYTPVAVCVCVCVEIFLLYPLTGASIAHKLLGRGLQKCLAFKDDSPAACTDYMALINTSVSQLGHMPHMSVRDVFALATLMGLYLSPASGHQKAYKELLAYVDAGHALT